MYILNAKIRFVSDYFQARYSDKAKAETNSPIGRPPSEGQQLDDESWKELLYKDEQGIYIPAMQLKGAIDNAGIKIKKKPRGSFKDACRAYLFIDPERIYIGKQEPDYINTSHPKRKDGMRVKLLHPAFKKGLEVEFKIVCLNDDLKVSTIKAILEVAGRECAVGAWRPMHGRFEVVEVKSE